MKDWQDFLPAIELTVSQCILMAT